VTRFSVNLNKIALLRNSRGTDFPKVLDFARRAIDAGSHGITVHPRPDQRHATYQDVYDLRELTEQAAGVEFNVEGNPVEKFMAVVKATRPDQCTLVPDAENQLTSDHGWNLRGQVERVKATVDELHACDIRVSLFMDPDPALIDLAAKTGAERIELYTEPYAQAFGTDSLDGVLAQFRSAAGHAQELGLGVNAGHDLNLQNLTTFLTIPNILEVSIGHAVMVESFDFGFDETIRRYVALVSETRA
jgi:pyridoxine 5-phosphate synthase